MGVCDHLHQFAHRSIGLLTASFFRTAIKSPDIGSALKNGLSYGQ